MVRGSLGGVSGKRRLRGRGFEAGPAFGDRLFGSGCGLSAPALELTVLDSLQSFGQAPSGATTGRLGGTDDIAGDRGGGRRRRPFNPRQTSSRPGRTTAPPRLDGSLPTQTGYWAIRIRGREALVGPKAIRTGGRCLRLRHARFVSRLPCSVRTGGQCRPNSLASQTTGSGLPATIFLKSACRGFRRTFTSRRATTEGTTSTAVRCSRIQASPKARATCRSA